MAEPIPAGSDVSAGTYECTSCGNRLQVGSTQHLPPCPSCGNAQWRTVRGGDSSRDPYPDRRSSSSRRRSSTSSRGRSTRRTSSSRSDGEKTKEQLYAEARRLGIEGRSKMNKTQLARAVGRRRGTSSRRQRSGTATPVEVQAFLEGVNYPVRKGDLVRQAERQGARQEVRATLAKLPDNRFDSPTEVSESIGSMR